MSSRNVRARLDVGPVQPTYPRSGLFQQVRRLRTKRARKSVMRSRISPGGIHAFTRWGIASQYNSVTQQGSLNFNSNFLYSDGTLTTNASTSGVTSIPVSSQFTFSDVSNNAEFAALYDSYKLNGVLVTIKMLSNPDASYSVANTPVNQYTNYYPTLWYTPDYDDVSLMTLAQIREYKAVKTALLRPNKEIKIFIKPRVLRQVFDSTTNAGYEITPPKFIDMGNNALPHYGLKMCFDFDGLSIPINTVVNQWRFRINYKYFFQCKDVR